MARPIPTVRTASSGLLSWLLLPTFIGYLFIPSVRDVPLPRVGTGCTSFAPTVALAPRDASELLSDFTVSGVCCSAFSFTGMATGNNPTLTLTRGVTYTFTLTSGAAHPFAFRATAGGANILGPFTADFTFTPDFVMPTNMVYQCAIHSPMLGNIVLVNPNNPPNASNLSAPETFTEEVALNLTDIVVSDVDNTTTTATLTLSTPSAGSLNTGTSGPVTSTYNSGTGVWNANGPIANVNTLLAALTFTPAANFSSNFTIATSVSDGIAAAITGTKTMTAIGVNDAPTLGSAALAAVNEDTSNPPGQSVSTIFTGQFTDPDPGAGLAGIAVLLNTASAATQGVWQYSTNAGTNWFSIGSVSAPSSLVLSASTLVRFVPVLNFNGAPTALSVRGLDNTYAGSFSTTAGSETRVSISTAVNGGTTAIATAVASLSTTITAVNDAPTASNLNAGEAYTEDVALNLIDIVAGDLDNTNVTATLTLSNSSAGSLNTATSGVVTSTFSAGVWSASGAIVNVNTLLAALTFTPALNFNSAFTIITSVSDGIAAPITGSKAMTGTAVNDAPTATNMNAGEAYTEDVALNLIDIVASDVDNANVTVTLTLSNPSAGSLNTGTSGAVTSTFSAGVWSANGAIANVNTLLAGLTFTPAANFNSALTITTSLSDGVAAPVTGSKSMTGTAVNDAPTASNLNAGEAYTEDVALNLIDIVASDVDNANVTVTLTLSNPSAGSLNMGTSGAVTSTFSAGVWSASGAIANVNTLLAGLAFTPAGDFNSAFSITTSVSDGIAAPATGSKAMSGTAVNDAPTASNLNAGEAYTEDVALNLMDIVASDVDNANVTVTLTLSNPSAGSLNMGTSGAVTSTFSAGVWSASGAIANVNTLLAGLTFTPAVDFNSLFSISTSVSDGIAAPATGSKAMSGTAVNDAPQASNLSAAEAYTQDTPLDLVDIVASDVDDAALTATLTLSNIAAGSLTTATSGVVTSTYTAGTGVWQASGAVADVNTLLAGVLYVPASGFTSSFSVLTSVSDGVAAPLTGSKAMTGTATNVTVAVRVFLEGAYSAATGLMNDALRSASVLPTAEPFTGLGYAHVGGGGESTTGAVFTVTGSDAIVDWVVLELRDMTTPATILATRSALVQCDGDVVDMDGVSPVSFSMAAGSYYIAARHRNHLGCMTGTTVALSASPANVDFTSPATSLFGTAAVKSVPGAFPAQVLWAGDATFNGLVQYTGAGNDRDPILVTVGSTTPNNVISNTYSIRDVNMNTEVKYTGSGNDRDPILVNVGNTTPNNVRAQQLP